MALTEEQSAAIRAEAERRQTMITVKRHDGRTAVCRLPLGGFDYLDLSALREILHALGYKLRAVHSSAMFKIEPLPGDER